MPRRSRKAQTFKDSGPVRFEVTNQYEVPRRMLKAVFDREKAALLEDLSMEPETRVMGNRIAHVRKLDIASFVSMLQGEFHDAVTLGDINSPSRTEDITEWAGEQFEDWASPQK